MSHLRASSSAARAGRCVQIGAVLALTSVCGLAAARVDVPAQTPGKGLLQLRTGDFETSPDTDFLLTNEGFSPGWHVVKLDGPMTPARHEALTAAGLRLTSYLPEHAWMEPLDADRLAALRAVPFVEWVGAFRAEWKIDPELDARPYKTVYRQDLQARGLCKIVVVLFEGENTDEAAAALAAAKANVIDSNFVGGQWLIDAETTPAAARGLASLATVQFVEDAPEGTFRNDSTRWIIQSNTSGQLPVWNAGLTGQGQIAGVIDGTPRLTHCMFSDTVAPGPTHRKFVGWRNAGSNDTHGTHVAGTIAGDATPYDAYTTHDGIAYRARMSFSNASNIWSSTGTLEPRLNDAFNDGARVHSNSWGDDGTTAYTTWCRQIDVHTWNNQDSVVAFAVSNQSTLKTPENSINVLGVGATSDTPNQANRCYGGAGPTFDGRRKPEIYAPGCDTVSASNSTCGTTSLSGTSMACPAVSAGGLLVRQYYTEGFHPSGTANAADAFVPTGALIRATLLNGTVDMTGVAGYPSNAEGWGRLLLDNVLYFPADTTRRLWLRDVRHAAGGLTTGQVVEHQFQCNGSQTPLKVTMVFTGPPAAVNASNPVINNLDLEVVSPSGTTYLGNVFTSGQSSAGGTADNKNNVEQVLINTPTSGLWTVRIRGTAVNQGPQGFAVVASGNISEPCAGATITGQPQSQTVDEGSMAVFSVAATGTGLQYQWRRNGVALSNNSRTSGAQSSVLTINPVQSADAGTYDVLVINACASVPSDGAVLTVNIPNPCPPDIDGTPGLGVSDIFTFLGLWFANDPQADWDGAGGVQVADIFAYLSDWFAGC